MDFKYLYNPDNGICHPYNADVANGRSDLIPLGEDELKMLRTMAVADILAWRAANSAPTASVVVETDDEPPQEETAPMPVSDAHKAKGVSVEGKIEKPVETDEFNFVDAKKDYRKYVVYGGETFPIDEVANIPDGDVVRFAKEVLKRNYEEASEFATDEEKAAHYAMLREKLVKALTRIYKKRAVRKAAEVKNGGNN